MGRILKIKDMKLQIILAMSILTSCMSAKKCQEKYCKADTVTVMVHDTVRTETIQTDTVFHNSVDSVTIFKDKLKIVYKRIHDSVYINGECEGDTIYISKNISIPVFHPEPTTWQMIKGVRWWILVVFLIGTALGLYLKPR